MSAAAKPAYEWKGLPFRDIERNVFKLQKRIYQASKRGDVKMVHRLQRLLMKSWSAKCLAVRRVTQDNQGKKTAGVDGVKSLNPKQRLGLVRELDLDEKAKPTRRVWIPKPGKDEKRPLGIPTMRDRALQALAKLAIEPEWEAKFEPNSYGFRPGRSCHDAVDAIFHAIKFKPKYVLDADIAKCFDRIDHRALLDKLSTGPTLRRAIKRWLKAGVMDDGELFPTTEGTPQGGVISPLLANIALHGLETAVSSACPGTRVVRYADDFVVLHKDLAAIEQAKEVVSGWLKGMGLEMKPSKTRISHTLTEHKGEIGFDFLGFNVRQYLVGKTRSGKSPQSRLLGFTTNIKPSKEAMHRHSLAIKGVVRRHQAAPQACLIHHLNPVIRGWASYYSGVVSKKIFNKMDHLTYIKLRRWAKRRHSNKSLKWVSQKYWRLETGKWDFATKDGKQLSRHSQTPIVRHVKVRGAKSPYDGDWGYWASRMGRHPELPKRVATLLKWQKGKCARCGLYFKHDDQPEIDYIIPKTQGGKDGYINWQLVHRHCHDQKASEDRTSETRSTRDKSQAGEEPDEGKLSRPVLKTSRSGDRPA